MHDSWHGHPDQLVVQLVAIAAGRCSDSGSGEYVAEGLFEILIIERKGHRHIGFQNASEA